MWKYSRRSIADLKPVYFFMSLFSITPLFSFKQTKIIYWKLQVSYSVTGFTLASALTIGALLELFSDNKFKKYLIMEMLLVAFTFSSNCCISLVMICRRRAFEELLRRLANLEALGNLNTFGAKQSGFMKRPVVCLVLYILVVSGFDLARLVSNRGLPLNFLLYRFTHAVRIFIALFHYVVLLIILRDKYRDVELLLLGSRSERNGDKIRKCRRLFAGIEETAKICNQLSGAPLFFIFFYCGFRLVYMLTAAYNSYWSFTTCIGLFGNGVVALIPLIVSLFAHQANNQAKRLQKTCRTLLLTFNMESERYMEMLDFYEQISHQQVKFTAERFFDLERSTIIRYLYVISNYFITFIQFEILSA